MTEGVGYGKTDTSGYNNAYYPDCTDPDIVFAGSSHMEALQVPQDANCVYLLNEMFDKDDSEYNNFKCFNMGVSGNFFEATASNFRYIADKFQNSKYIVIEVFNTEFSPSMIDEIIEEKFSTPMAEKSFMVKALQSIPAINFMKKKVEDMIAAKQTPAANVNEAEPEDDMDTYNEKMGKLLGKISAISAEYNFKPVILLHERFWTGEDGNIIMETDETYKNAFKKCCENNGIKVIDASPEMIEHYKNSSEFSYGFSNSAPGEGHLNKTGHRLIAEIVYKHINEMEESK